MLMRSAFLVAALLVAGSAKAGDAPPDCATSALLEYSRQVLALSQAPEAQPIPSVEAVVAKRRLQEAYCLRSTQCIFGSPSSSKIDLEIRAEFAHCLDEEAEQGK